VWAHATLWCVCVNDVRAIVCAIVCVQGVCVCVCE
jgi:hypothetical protein